MHGFDQIVFSKNNLKTMASCLVHCYGLAVFVNSNWW